MLKECLNEFERTNERIIGIYIKRLENADFSRYPTYFSFNYRGDTYYP